MRLSNIPHYLNLSAGDFARIIKNYPSYYLRRGKGERYAERKIHDYRMLLDLTDQGISRELWLAQSREKEHIIMLKAALEPGMSVLDIGANIGYYSVMMGRLVGDQGKVYAVEPSASNFDLLKINLGLNGLNELVETFNVGISNETGEGDFFESERSNWHTFYPQVHTGTETESLVGGKSIRVPVITIPEFLKGKRSIDLIRMDVEGFEVEILTGLLPLLEDESFGPKILFEVHQPRYDDNEHDMRGILGAMFEAGYRVETLASNHHTNGGAEVFRAKGYEADEVIKTDFQRRGMFSGVSNADALEFMCDSDFVRAALLTRES